MSARAQTTEVALERTPHLAVLEIVQHAIGVAIRAMVAESPELIGEPHPWRSESADTRAARRLFRHLFQLDRALARYRRALLVPCEPPEPESSDDIDF